ncbi:MAG: hypothetical protein Q9209_006310 [Squamulea sp. 1 TL-2023]
MADYNRLARVIANHGEISIFRRFDTSNLKSLLYMQAELVHLEVDLEKLEKADRLSTDPRERNHRYCVFDLKESGGMVEESQWKKYLEIRQKIQAYIRHLQDGALLQYASLRKVARPTPNDVECLRGWLERENGGNNFLQGREDGIWKSNNDFISLDPIQSDKDMLTYAVTEIIVPWYHNRWGYRSKVAPGE